MPATMLTFYAPSVIKAPDVATAREVFACAWASLVLTDPSHRNMRLWSNALHMLGPDIDTPNWPVIDDLMKSGVMRPQQPPSSS